MTSTKKRRAGATFTEIAEAGATSHTTVRRVLVAAFPHLLGKGRNAIPRDVGDLVARAFKGKALDQSAGRLLGENPAAVLEAAEALAELARRRIAEQQQNGPVAA
ncbi:hypothetical protein ACFZAV_42785 [Streptomyces sp. NPDC008343]|uniref:hypothetical protein n=1 Tax=Streptomyces sp. NPDC008343 TaxID=3364828 RepID=UPI0036E6A6AE